MQQQVTKSFLGTGWTFPPTFRERDHTLELVSEEEDIRQSLYLLIATSPGERILHPAYGCDLQKFVFEPMSETLRHEIKDAVSRAISLFELRVVVEEVEVFLVSIEPGIVHIVVKYTIIQTNSRGNIVYPFYLQEGTSVVL